MFFFSSRRRHTRYWRDWSSDVCSSDLRIGTGGSARGRAGGARGVPARQAGSRSERLRSPAWGGVRRAVRRGGGLRSEERRVGEEWRSRGGPDYLKKKIRHVVSRVASAI